MWKYPHGFHRERRREYPHRQFPFISPSFPQGNHEAISAGMIPWNSPINPCWNLGDADGSPAGKRLRECHITVLWLTIIKANPKLRDINLVFVTDGDETIVNSIRNTFHNVTLFRCRLHLLKMGGTAHSSIVLSHGHFSRKFKVKQYRNCLKLENAIIPTGENLQINAV